MTQSQEYSKVVTTNGMSFQQIDNILIGLNKTYLSDKIKYKDIRLSLLLIVSETAVRLKNHEVTYYKYRSNTLPLDISLEYLFALESDRITITPLLFIKRLIKSHLSRLLKSKYVDESVSEERYEIRIEDKLLLRDKFREIMINAPLKYRMSFIYYVKFPCEINNFSNFNRLEKFILSSKISKIVKNNNEESLEISMLNTQTSKMLFLSGLYKQNPAILVLFLLLKDYKKFIQFCNIFSGTTIKIPSSEEIKGTIENVSRIVSKCEEEDMSIKDKETLLYLSTTMDDINELEGTDLNPTLEEFLKEIMTVSITNYNKFQEKVIDRTNMSSIDDISKTYKVLNSELKNQLNLIKEVSSAMESLSDLKEFFINAQKELIENNKSEDILKNND